MLDIAGKMCVISCDGLRYGFRPRRVTLRHGDTVSEIEGEMFPIFGESNKFASRRPNFEIDRVIFNNPATVVIWKDGTKTVVKCQENDEYSEEIGLAMCIAKKALGNKGNYNEVFKKWIPVKPVDADSVERMRDALCDFCYGKSCARCALKSPVCRCGCGTHFKTTKRFSDEYDMTDDEIRKAYAVVFRK